MDKYLYIAPSVIIQRYESRDRELFVLQSPEQNEKERLTGGKRYKINSVAAEIIACLDGTRTFGEIVAYFSKKYSDDETHVRQTVQSYFDKLESLYGFSVKEIEEPTLFPVQFTDYKSIYPTVVSIELTDKCNFRCKHCYGSFKPENEHEIPNEMLQPLFTSLKEIGVLTVELTGGDVSVYPHTATAIETAINCGIQSVMILTNGAIISDDIIKVMSKYKDRCFVQVDLHSLNTEYFDWFTGTKGMLPKVMHNIDVLIAAGVQVRVCSIITPLNFQEFVDIASWSHQHGANLFAPSATVDLGRANSNQELLFLNEKELLEFNEMFETINDMYPGFIKGKSTADEWKRDKCGALTSQCSIRSNGDVKLCTMDTGNYFKLNIGNVFEKTIKEIYDDNTDFLYAFSDISLPHIDSTTCKECVYVPFCHGCLLRGFLKAQEVKDDCAWYKETVPEAVKKHFPI